LAVVEELDLETLTLKERRGEEKGLGLSAWKEEELLAERMGRGGASA
jgi:hypothetical protein